MNLHRHERFEDIPLILEKEEIEYTRQIHKILQLRRGSEVADRAKSRSLKINVSKFLYKSQGSNIVGFIAEPREGKKLPCIIFNRGGSKTFSIWTEYRLFLLPSLIASWGYIVITSQYAGSGGSEGNDEFGGSEVSDVLMLYDILGKYAKADIDRVGMYGASRGGMMTYLILTRVKWLRAAISQAGVSNLTRNFKERPELKQWLSDLFDVDDGEALKSRSAVFWANKFFPKTPLLLLHGTRDAKVSVLDSLELAEELYKNKIPYRLVIFEGADHSINEFSKEKIRLIKEWFDRYVKNVTPLPNLKFKRNLG